MRNFWIEAVIDGREHRLKGGPRAKIGGFDMDILQRVNGTLDPVIRIWGNCDENGTITLWIYPPPTTAANVTIGEDGIEVVSQRG